MAQRWQDLLFAHWAVDLQALRPLVPAPLAPDTRDGAGWVSITPFEISRLRSRGLPPAPGLSRFPELNVRTYVTWGGKPGVFFFSLDAGSWLAVLGARTLYGLPYFRAEMQIARAPDGTIRYASRRRHGARPAELEVAYHPMGAPRTAAAGTLDHWLTERYCLYTVNGRHRVYRTEIHHAPWPLQPVETEIRRNTMAAAAGIRLPAEPPRVAFARCLDVVAWWPTRASDGA
jgi:uncharacterized protein YqjF (DUF2071 family)